MSIPVILEFKNFLLKKITKSPLAQPKSNISILSLYLKHLEACFKISNNKILYYLKIYKPCFDRNLSYCNFLINLKNFFSLKIRWFSFFLKKNCIFALI